MYVLYLGFILLIFVSTIPLQILVALVICVSSGFPVLFAQKRVGKNGKPFTMYKFRTMVSNAEAVKSRYANLNESQGPTFKIRHDPRFTSVGKFLSHTGIDELPQFINVLRGEMSLFGPRPLPTAEAKQLKAWMRARHDILPGIISPAILTGTYHEDFDAWMKSDIDYVRTKSFGRDAVLLFQFVLFIAKLLLREIL